MADRYEERARELVESFWDRPEPFTNEQITGAIASALRDQDAWWPIDDPEHPAPRDGTRILVVLRNPIPLDRGDLRAWDGVPFVARHPGVPVDGFDIGWNFAAPVGQGGFPDEWIAGWRHLPAPPLSGRTPDPSISGEPRG